jgi:hypothetical protein
MSKNESHHVVKNPSGGWSVKKLGSNRASGNYSTQSAAISSANVMSRNQGTLVFVHGEDGRVSGKLRPGVVPGKYGRVSGKLRPGVVPGKYVRISGKPGPLVVAHGIDVRVSGKPDPVVLVLGKDSRIRKK